MASWLVSVGLHTVTAHNGAGLLGITGAWGLAVYVRRLYEAGLPAGAIVLWALYATGAVLLPGGAVWFLASAGLGRP